MKSVVFAAIAVLLMSSCTSINKKSKNDSKSLDTSNDKAPSLTSPKVHKVWVPDKIDGDKYIEGHWMWVLERTTTWSQ